VLKFDSWGALKIGTAEPRSHARVATATQCVSAILGVYLNGTLNQVAVRVGRAQVPAKAADIAWFLCTSSHPTKARLAFGYGIETVQIIPFGLAKTRRDASGGNWHAASRAMTFPAAARRITLLRAAGTEPALAASVTVRLLL
jgi:hypothetical protein